MSGARRDATGEGETPKAGPLLILLGLTANDGSGELAYCRKGGENADDSSPGAFLLDLEQAWDPDGDGGLAAICPRCRVSHWTIPFVVAVLEGKVDCGDDGLIILAPEIFLAENVANLRARASARTAATS